MTNVDMELAKIERALPDQRPDLGQDGKTRLPGLTLIFFIGLCVSGVLCALGAFFPLRELTKAIVWQYNAKYIFGGMATACLAGAGLSWWVGYAIYERLQSAPFRCRVMLTINIFASVAGILGLIIFLFVNMNTDRAFYSATDIMMRYSLPELFSNLLAVIIFSEAWWRYFLYSAKVRQTFNLYLPVKRAREIPPAEIGLFTVVCWLCPVYYGLPNLVWLYESYVMIVGGVAFLILHAVFAASYLTLPFVALYALRTRRLPVIFWCLGLWLGLQGVIWLLNIASTFHALGDIGTYGNYNYAWGLPRLFSERLFIPLAFWWYFSVSEKAQAWFSAQRPSGEHLPAAALSAGA